MSTTDTSEHVRTVDSATPRLTIKQERFAQALVRLAGNASQAYREAYDAHDWSEAAINTEAYRLRNHPQVSLRIATLEAEAAASASLNPAWIASRLMRNVEQAIEKPRTPQFGASNQALEMLARFLRLPGYERAGSGDTTNVQVNVTVEQLAREYTTDELKTLLAQAQAQQLTAPGDQGQAQAQEDVS